MKGEGKSVWVCGRKLTPHKSNNRCNDPEVRSLKDNVVNTCSDRWVWSKASVIPTLKRQTSRGSKVKADLVCTMSSKPAAAV